MFRKATIHDIDEITELYMAVHTEEEAGRMSTGWIRSVYPTRQTVESAVNAEDLFVEVEEGKIVAVGRINHEQVDVYANVRWDFNVSDKQVMVLHTLAVHPTEQGKGYATAFCKFYEEYALEHGCNYLRIDTNEKNKNARKLYKKLGYKEVGIVPCIFNGIEGVPLVCLEKRIEGLNPNDLELIEAARNAIIPNYDNVDYLHTVGAALRCGSGKIYTGVNVYSLHGTCAEQVALGCAITNGEREFLTVVAVRGKQGEEILPPCGNCSQILGDYAPGCEVILSEAENGIKLLAKELLPFAYKVIV